MKISLITPANNQSRAGNRTTAVRWARMLRNLEHQVRIAVNYQNDSVDLMMALHAWRSADSIDRFRRRYPDRPLVVVLTGTDIYRFQESDPDLTLGSMEAADALVCLHDLVHEAIPKRFGTKLHVIYQSAEPLPKRRTPSKRHFDICVIGHLREEKDSLRTAYAVRELPASSRVRVIHLGKAHTESWADDARAEMATNPRYRWRGEVPGWVVRREFGKTHLMVLSSIMEGGANVISEAVVAGVPVIASDIPGSVGLLGRNYPGYYPARDTTALAGQIHRAETDAKFLDDLTRHCKERAPLFRPAGEQTSLGQLVHQFDPLGRR